MSLDVPIAPRLERALEATDRRAAEHDPVDRVSAPSPELRPFAAAFNTGFGTGVDDAGRLQTPSTAYARFSDLSLIDPARAARALADLGTVRDPWIVSALGQALTLDTPGVAAVREGALDARLASQDRRVARDWDDVVPIAFPDYRISVLGQKLPNLGHAGILLIDDETGLTKYYEYGRYDEAGIGTVRQRTVPNAEIDPATSRPTQASMDRILRSISDQAGQRGDIRAAYIDNAADFDAMHAYAERREAQNGDPSRTPYSVWSNSCNTFMRDVAEAGGVDMPWIVLDRRPNGYIEKVRADHLNLDYDAETGVSTISR